MSCRDCEHHNNCAALIYAIEDWDESEAYESTGDMVEDIEDRLPATCGKFEPTDPGGEPGGEE